MNKKSYFLIIFLTSVSFTILANNNISEKVIAVQEKYIVCKLIEMYENNHLTKENLDALKNTMQIESFEKILLHKQKLLSPTLKSYIWTSTKGLFFSMLLFSTTLIKLLLTQYWFDLQFKIEIIIPPPNRTKLTTMTELLTEMWPKKNISDFITIMSPAIGLSILSSYILRKIYYKEYNRRKKLKIINNIIKELKQLRTT